jgi:toxin ParE1/3/4
MVSKVIIKPLAVLDIDEILEWYEQKSKGLGKRFYLHFQLAIDSIVKDPDAYFNITPQVRRVLLKNFPFKVFYTVSNNTIFILGVLHAKRSKRYISRRLKF